MDLTNEWYIYDDAIDSATCTKIIELADNDFEQGKMYGTASSKNERASDVFWTKEQWLIDLIWSYMQDANEQAGWQYKIVGIEPMQITRYKTDDFINFHTDGGSDNFTPDNRIRKLSMTVILNDAYEGGQFQFASLTREPRAEINTTKYNGTGTVIVFPSFMMHRVKPVTKGVRYSLVAWFIGEPFK